MYKNCPNCGARVNSDMRFCNNCGYDFATAPQEPTVSSQNSMYVGNQRLYDQPMTSRNQRSTATPSNSNGTHKPQNRRQNTSNKTHTACNHNYWQYLLSGAAHPFAPKRTFDARFGLITLGASALLAGIATMVGSNSLLSSPFSIGLHSFILLLVSNFIIASVAFLVRRVFLGDKHKNYLEILTEFGHYTNLNLFLGMVLLIWRLFGLNLAGYYLIFGVGGLLLQAAFLFTIFKAQSQAKLDKSYAYFIGLIIAAFAIGLVIAILGVATLNDLMQSGNNLLG